MFQGRYLTKYRRWLRVTTDERLFFFSLLLSLIDYNRMLEYYSPISNAAELALTLNWFSISLGRKAAKPAISNPSLAPARFNMKKPGLPSRSVRARGSSRIFENASPRSLEDDCFLVLLWCASDTLSLANFSEPGKEIFIRVDLCVDRTVTWNLDDCWENAIWMENCK